MRIEIVHSIVTPDQQENLKEAVIFKLEPRKLQGWHSPEEHLTMFLNIKNIMLMLHMLLSYAACACIIENRTDI